LTINGLHLLNIGSGAGHWGINIGVSGARANLTTIVNSGITVENCLFDNINGPFEQLLVFNSQDVRIENNHFTNIAFHPSGGSLGLYQNDTNFLVENNTFGPNIGNNTIYFAIGDKSLQIIHNTFIGKGAESTQVGDNGIKGANESDHGLFGQTTADNITVENNSFSGLRIALQLGGVNGATVMGNTFSQNGTAILINNANILHKDNPNVEGVHSSNLTIANNVFSGDLANQTTVEGSGDAVPRRTKP
jgi:hypothetical protein